MRRRPSSKRFRSLIIAAFLAIVFGLGGLASNLIAADLQTKLEPYRIWIWSVFIIALLVSFYQTFQLMQQSSGIFSDYLGNQNYQHLRRQYLNEIVKKFKYLPLRGIDFKSSDACTQEEERLCLADIYIAMDVKAASGKTGVDNPARQLGMSGKENPLPALEAFVKNRHTVILGGAGSGKSTFVNYLAFCLASEQLNPKEDWISRLDKWPKEWSDLLPIPIIIRDLAAWLDKHQPSERKTPLFRVYLQEWLKQMGVPDFYNSLCGLINDGKALIILDGLDEAPPSDENLAQIKTLIDDLPAAYPETPILVTCRVLSYQDDRWRLSGRNWSISELARLDQPKIDAFIKGWYHQLAAMQAVKKADPRIAKLHLAVRRRGLKRLAPEPLLLTVIALVHTHKGELPDARVLLYEDITDLLLWRWEAIKIENQDGEETGLRQLLRKADIKDIELKEALWELAFKVHSRSKRQVSDKEAIADITYKELFKTLESLHDSWDWVRDMIHIMQMRAGLLVENAPQEIYQFPHRTFQEFLAGCHLSRKPKFTEETIQLADQGAYWREAILLAVGDLAHSGRLEKPLMLVSELCPMTAPEAEDVSGWRKIVLAGQCMLEIGQARAQRSMKNTGRELSERVKRHLTTLITEDRLEPRERADAGSVLSELGDERNLNKMAIVQESRFIMGSTSEQIETLLKKNEDMIKQYPGFKTILESEKPQHEVSVKTFQISKYPVTNEQYTRFVYATGHEPPEHWRGVEPPPELRNHPVVYVNWFDACAYCKWQSKEQNKEVRLPSEAEWEKAARGSDARIYPWGDEFNSVYCNSYETGVGATSPVGMFKQGASVYKCMDMAGNVWEWTQTVWGESDEPEFEYPYRTDDGRENMDMADKRVRVLRGGSFGHFSLNNLRCAFRNRFIPHDWDNHVSFRVVSPGL